MASVQISKEKLCGRADPVQSNSPEWTALPADGKQIFSFSHSVFGKKAGLLPCLSCFQNIVTFLRPPYDCKQGCRTRLLRRVMGQQDGRASSTQKNFPQGLFVLPGFWRNALEQDKQIHVWENKHSWLIKNLGSELEKVSQRAAIHFRVPVLESYGRCHLFLQRNASLWWAKEAIAFPRSTGSGRH